MDALFKTLGITRFASRTTLIAGALTAFLTAALTIANAVSFAEPYWFATRGFTRQLMALAADDNKKSYDLILERQLRTELSVKESQRLQIQGKIDDLNLLLKKDGNASVDYIDAIQRQIRDSKLQLELLNEQISRMSRENAANRPE